MAEPANRDTSASMAGRSGGTSPGSLLHAALQLPWLVPSASSLVALTRPPATAWPTIQQDPGALLLLLRSPSLVPAEMPFPEALSPDAKTLELALHLLDQPAPFLDWNDPRARPLYDAARCLARLCRAIARHTGRLDPDQAWCAGMLAPLGWFALAAIDPGRVANTLLDAAFSRFPQETPRSRLGVDPVLLARRLLRSWDLPTWLGGILSHLDLPLDHARRFGVDPVFFSAMRLAIQSARNRGMELGLEGSADLHAEENQLGLRLGVLDGMDFDGEEDVSPTWINPQGQPLLRELLSQAAENRRLRDQPGFSRLEHELDNLHSVLAEQVRGEGDRLRAAKLSGLAEFAAGASHEINNPLAVISGQAQYILSHESDWLISDEEGEARQSLQTIIQQTRRIHAILRDLMQFARPAPPRPSWIDLPTLLGEVASSLEELAASKQVKIEIVARPERQAVLVDPEQVRSALSCLLRNAIEAAPEEGWTRLALLEPGPADRVEVFVEDSGTGPAPEQRPHLFDPFYSGRSAGRGKGLGLPLAWRLIRQQGGDVFLEPVRLGQPTRFVLSLPRHTNPAGIHAA